MNPIDDYSDGIIFEEENIPDPPQKPLKEALEEYKLAYEAGDLTACIHGIVGCYLENVPLPDWLFGAVHECIAKYIRLCPSSRSGRNAQLHSKYEQDRADCLSFLAVKRFRNESNKGDKAFHQAILLLKFINPEWNWTLDTVRNGYYRYLRRKKKNPYRYFIHEQESTREIDCTIVPSSIK